VPPTINLDSPDPACDLDYVPHIGRACRVDQALNYSAGFGGHNLALIFSRFAG
jgi:3-oxoacyl-[acyl-carrier-protein] synthase II